MLYAFGAVYFLKAFYKELTFRQHIVKETFQLIALEVILIGFGLGSKSLLPENIKLTAAFAFSIFVIYILVGVISWLLDSRQAKLITYELKTFQSRFLEK